MRGAIPAELVKEAKGGEVHVDMEDHRSYLMEVCCRPHSSERTHCKIALTRSQEKLLLPGVSLHYNYNSITNEFHLREEEFVREPVSLMTLGWARERRSRARRLVGSDRS